MKNVSKSLVSVVAAVLMLGGSNALAGDSTCFINVTAPCRYLGPDPQYAPNRYFVDSDPMANANAGRCVERAQEYKSRLCADSGGLEASAIWQVNGRNVIGSVTSSNGHSYIWDGVTRFTPFHD
jgi:hypothetical protein